MKATQQSDAVRGNRRICTTGGIQHTYIPAETYLLTREQMQEVADLLAARLPIGDQIYKTQKPCGLIGYEGALKVLGKKGISEASQKTKKAAA